MTGLVRQAEVECDFATGQVDQFVLGFERLKALCANDDSSDSIRQVVAISKL